MRWRVLLVALAVAGCSAPPASTQPVALGSAAPTAGASHQPGASPVEGAANGSPRTGTPPSSLAVLVDLFPATAGYDVSLVAYDGSVAARAHAQLRTPIADAAELPYVSTSSSRLYFLDGDTTVRWLKPDGTGGVAGTVAGGPQVHATFAVSPDDRRIAVAVLDYSVSPVALTLYVEDLGGANRAVIYTSTSRYVWPVGWRSGRLVVAYMGPSGVPFKSKEIVYSSRDLDHYPLGPNPYGGVNVHVIDAATAQRLAIVGGGGNSGLLTAAGSADVQGGMVDWSGTYEWNTVDAYGSISSAASLSPDGQAIVACCSNQGALTGSLTMWYRDGHSRQLPVPGDSGDWTGWFDNIHLISGFYQAADGNPMVVDLATLSTHAVDAHGFVAAMLPEALSA